MEQVRIDFLVTGNMSSLSSQIQAINAELMQTGVALSAMNKGFASMDAQAANRQFGQLLTSSGQFTAQTITMKNRTDEFAKSLERAKLTGRQYFRESVSYLTKQRGAISALAAEQVRLQNSIVQPLGKNQLGQMRAAVYTPTGLPSGAATDLQLANKRWEIFNDLASKGSTHMVNWGKNTQWAGRQLMVGFTVPLMMVGGLAAKTFKQLDEELVRLQKVYGSGFSFGDDFKKQSMEVRAAAMDMAHDMARAYGQAGTDTAALMADLAATGFEGQDLMRMTEQTTKLATLGEVDRQEAMKATVALQSAFKMSTEEVADSVLFLNAVENQTSASLSDLVEAIPRAGTVVKGLGGDIQDLSLYMVAFREGGISAAEGANALKSGLSSVIAPPKAAVDFMKDFGINLPALVKKNAGDLTGTLVAFQKELMSLDDLARQQVITKLFGKYQFARMNAFFNNLGAQGSQTQKVLDLMGTSMEDLGKLAEQEVGAQAESVSGKWTRAWEDFKISITGVGEQMMKFGTWALEALMKVFNYIEGNPVLKFLAKVGTIVAASVGPIIMVMGLLGNMIGMLIKGVLRFANQMKALGSGGGISKTFKMLSADTLMFSDDLNILEKEMYDHARAEEVVAQAAREWAMAMEGVTAATMEAAAATQDLVAAQRGTGGAVPPLVPSADRGGFSKSLYAKTGQEYQFAHRTPENMSDDDARRVAGWLGMREQELIGKQVHYGAFSASYQSSEANAKAGQFLPYFAATGKNAQIGMPAGIDMTAAKWAAIDPEVYIADIKATMAQLGMTAEQTEEWMRVWGQQIRELSSSGATLEESQKMLAQATQAADRAAVAANAENKAIGYRAHGATLAKGTSGSIRGPNNRYMMMAEQRILDAGGLYGSTAAEDQEYLRQVGAAHEKLAVEATKLSNSEAKAAAQMDLVRAEFDALNRGTATLVSGQVASKSALDRWTQTLVGEVGDLNSDDIIFQKMKIAEQEYAIALNKATGQVLSVRGYNAGGAIGPAMNMDDLSAEVKLAAEQFGQIVVRSAETAAEIEEANARQVAEIQKKAAKEEGAQELSDAKKEGAQELSDAKREGAQELADARKEGATEVAGAVTEEGVEVRGGAGGFGGPLGGKAGMGLMVAGLATTMLPVGGAAGGVTNALGMAATGAMMGSMAGVPGMIVGGIVGGIAGAAPTIYDSITRANREAAEQWKQDWELISSTMGETLSKDIAEAFNVKNFKPLEDIFKDYSGISSDFIPEKEMRNIEKFNEKVLNSFPDQIEQVADATAESASRSMIILYDKMVMQGMKPEKAQKIIDSILRQAEREELVIDVVARIQSVDTKGAARDSLRDALAQQTAALAEKQMGDFGGESALFGLDNGWFWNEDNHQADSRKLSYEWGMSAAEELRLGFKKGMSGEEILDIVNENIDSVANEIKQNKGLDWAGTSNNSLLEGLFEQFGLSGVDFAGDMRKIFQMSPEDREWIYDSIYGALNIDPQQQQAFKETWDDYRSYASGVSDIVGGNLKGDWADVYAAERQSVTGVLALTRALGDADAAASNLPGIFEAMANQLPGAFSAMIPEPSVTQDDVDKLVKEQERALNAEERAAERAKEAIDEQKQALEDQMDALAKRENALNRDIDQVNKYYDKEIAAIQRAEDKKQEAFDKEEERFNRRMEMRNLEISYDEAIANGQLYEAARIRMDMAATKKQREQEDAREKSAARAEARIKRLERKRKDELRPLKDKLRAIRQENRQLERQSEILDDRAEQIDQNLEDFKDAQKSELKALKNRVDREQREYQDLMDRVTRIWERGNLSMREKIKKSLELIGEGNKNSAKAFIAVWEDAFGKVGKSASNKIKDSIKSGDWSGVTDGLVKSLDLDPRLASTLESWMTSGPPTIKKTGDGWRLVNPDGTAGGPVMKAEGGMITGPGTATSDSIPARLSNGEYVVKASSVQKYGKNFLDGINEGAVPKFADGGIVGRMTAGLSAVAAMNMANSVIPLSHMAAMLGVASSGRKGKAGAFIPGQAGNYAGTAFTAEQLRNAATIVSVGKRMGASHRDLIIGLMTAMQESTLHNYKTAVDHDSLGLFQQRPSMGWGTPKQITNPKYASKKFFERLLAIKDRDELSLSAAAQRVQVSAYPDAYAKWEDEARAVLQGMSRGGRRGGGSYVKPFVGTYPVGRTFGQHGGTGLDVPMPIGTPLRAITSGRLTNHPFAFGSYGNWYTLDANGYGFTYAHLNSDRAKSGMIKRGQIIGYSGNTGNSFGPHLHFEARRGNVYSNQVDPHSLGIPGLRRGGRINYDNTLANLHRGETVLTRGLSDKFEDKLANVGGNNYNFDVTIENLNSEVDLERAFEKFVVRHERTQTRRNRGGRSI